MELMLSVGQFRNSLQMVFVTLVGSGSLNCLTYPYSSLYMDYSISCIEFNI